ncbi:hypothetical protein MJO29_016941 [Puccinia striiformis f. sp. tritici]|nr:hypothetical protein MJO29_016941 [Puccinia striiformis f. sp. tritici]
MILVINCKKALRKLPLRSRLIKKTSLVSSFLPLLSIELRLIYHRTVSFHFPSIRQAFSQKKRITLNADQIFGVHRTYFNRIGSQRTTNY